MSFCGEQDITSVSAKTYMSKLALVAPESTVYKGTVKQDATLNIVDADVTHDAIDQACRDAQIHDFIVSLPEWYATKWGPKTVQVSVVRDKD